MGFNTSKQRILKMAGLYRETGKLTFGEFSGTNTELTIEVPTKMTKKIVCGFGVTSDATAVSQDGVITDGCVTFTRPSGGSAGATFDYFLEGY